MSLPAIVARQPWADTLLFNIRQGVGEPYLRALISGRGAADDLTKALYEVYLSIGGDAQLIDPSLRRKLTPR